MDAFDCRQLKANHNAICTRVYFDLLQIISKQEATTLKLAKVEEYIASNCTTVNLDDLDKSTIRYIGGAAIHSVRQKLERMSMSSLMNKEYEANLNYRKHQLTSKLISSPQMIAAKAIEPNSLLKVIERDKGGLLYVTDQAFNFFQMLFIKLKLKQNLMSLQMDPQNVFLKSMNALTTDVELVETWTNLFITDSDLNDCTCTEVEMEMDEELTGMNDSVSNLEMEQLLLLDLFDQVVHYFCKVHFVEISYQLKDSVLEKPKTFQLRHTVNEKRPKETKIKFPCGICKKECIDILSKKKASFEEFSVECDACSTWFHYVCVNLSGTEPQLQDGSDLPYFCPSCIAAQNVSNVTSNLQEVQLEEEMDVGDVQDEVEVVSHSKNKHTGRGRGHASGHGRGRGRGHGRGRPTAVQNQETKEVNVASEMHDGLKSIPSSENISSRGRRRKPVKRDDFVT